MIAFDTPTGVLNHAKLADPRPPAPPAPPVALAQPKAHHLVTWRHDGEVRKAAHETKEAAQDAAAALHYAIAYKFMILCGREMVARGTVEVPS